MRSFDKKRPEAAQGLYRKYTVRRLNDPRRKHAECDYYVLDLRHDRHAIAALRAYAKSCEREIPVLAEELRSRARVLETLFPTPKPQEGENHG